jgi:FkbM family methyltransferase
MDRLGVDLVIDVGANTGQYIREIRANGFAGQIVAFEPLHQAFHQLHQASSQDPHLKVHQCALGSEDGDVVIHVSANSYSSSLLPMEEAHLSAAPDSGYVTDESVSLRRLDSFGLAAPESIVWLKIDVQGYERKVLMGASQTLEDTQAVEIELSYVALYEGQALAFEIQETLSRGGFRLATFGRPLHDPSGTNLLQIDAIFLRPGNRQPRNVIERG